MAVDKPYSFQRPSCNALYRVVEVEAGLDAIDRQQLKCRSCGGPLTSRKGNSVLKHFLARKAVRTDRQKNHAR